MIIDCHGHFTTVPKSFRDWRAAQVAAANDPANAPARFIVANQIPRR